MIWIVLLVAALVALDKSLLPGAGMLGIGALANVIPAKEATGLTLALIIIADWVAIWAYRKNVDFKALRRLLPNVVVGVVLGAGFLFIADDLVTRRLIGVIILVFVSWNTVGMLRKARQARASGAEGPTSDAQISPGGSTTPPAPAPEKGLATVTAERVATATTTAPTEDDSPRGRRRAKGFFFGSLAGFTTMVANAGGPVTSMYFLTEGFSVRLFLGTSAWFYLIINLVKLPFSLGLGMITWDRAPMLLAAVPVIIGTVMFGRWASGRINRTAFSSLIVVLTLATGVLLVL